VGWGASSVAKTVDPCPLIVTLDSLAELAGPVSPRIVAGALIWAEALLCLWLCGAVGDDLRRAALASLAMNTLLVVGAVLASASMGRVIDCPCFGRLLPVAWPWLVAKNCAMVACAVRLLRVTPGGGLQ